MATSEKNELELDQAQVVGRRMLVRNVLAMGTIAATAVLAKSTPARATPPDWAPTVGWRRGQCFLKGTKIRTAEGERKVEDLAVGDMLPTLFGGVRPIQWVGRYSYGKNNPAKPWANDAPLARIAHSALAPNVPHADLFVTSAHALFIDDVLVPAGDLINGITITRYAADEFDELEYYHIKLEGHDVIYAEGAACETLLTVSKTASNFAEYESADAAPETDESRCAPLLSYCGGRGQLRSRVRSAMSPWYDRREKLDVIRDRLEERAFALCEGVQRAA